MAVQYGIWKLGEKPQTLSTVKLEDESLLEDQQAFLPEFCRAVFSAGTGPGV